MRRSDERSRPARYPGRAEAWALGVALAFATLFLGARAEAQSVSLTNTTVNRATPDAGTGSTTTLQRSQDTQYYISYTDCIATNPPVSFVFSIGVSGDSSPNFEVWGTADSTDCSQDANRAPLAPPSPGTGCHPLQSGLAGSQVTIDAKALVTNVLGLSSCDAASTLSGDIDAGSTGSAASDPVPISIYFLLVDQSMGGAVPSSAYVNWSGSTAAQIDLWGPAPPPITLSSADQFVIVNLPTSTDTNTLGYFLFCNPPPGTDGGIVGTGGFGTTSSTTTSSTTTSSTTTSSGAGGAGGTGGAGTTSTTSTTTTSSGVTGTGGTGGGSTCTTNVVIPFLDPSHPDVTDPRVQPYICGNSPISPSSTGPTINGLTNGQEYVIGVVAYDEVDNIGPLSVLQCGTPEPTTTFFNQYCADGGAACPGCGNCAVGGDSDFTWTMLASSAVAAVAFGLRRARSRPRGKRDAQGRPAVNG